MIVPFLANRIAGNQADLIANSVPGGEIFVHCGVKVLCAGLSLLLMSACNAVQQPAGETAPAQVPLTQPAPGPTGTSGSPTSGTITDPAEGVIPGLADIPSNFDTNSLLVPSWGTGAVPGSAAPDVVGAFRFICHAGQVLADDPIVFPGQPGKSHLHQFFGNLNANSSSTYASLRSTGGSSCEGSAGSAALNRSAYWMPAMLDGIGHVVRPDNVAIYYKRRPLNDPKCSTSGDPQAEGNCVPLPNGLRFIFGYDMLTGEAPTGAGYFNCQGETGTQGHYPTITEAMAHCPTAQHSDGSYNQLGAVVNAPSCWDGRNLDSANHRSHVAYPGYGNWGYQRCPADHPFVIPTFTMGVWYTVDANLGKWHLSSDEMVPGAAPGSTFHADWFGAWDNVIETMWLNHCTNKLLNCSGGDLGNGMQIKNAWGGIPSWHANPRLVPVPS